MIYKTLARHDISAFGQLIRYIGNESKTLEQDNEPILHNIRSKPEEQEKIEQEFVSNEAFRPERKGRVYAYHSIISFSSKDRDNISDKAIQNIVQAYLDKRKNVMLYGQIHRNTEAVHIHFLESGTLYRENRASGLRFHELSETKKLLDLVIREHPEIKHSFCEHGKGKSRISDREYRAGQRGMTIKESLSRQVREIFQSSASRGEFIDKLAETGLHHYERTAGQLTGIVHEGTKYRFKSLDLLQEEVQTLAPSFAEMSRQQQLLEQLRRSREAHIIQNTMDLGR